MNKTIAIVLPLVMICANAFAAAPASQGRRSMSSQMMAAPRQVAPQQYNFNQSVSMTSKSSIRDETPNTPPPASDSDNATTPDKPDDKPAVDNREKERNACIRNNVGIGNTFVWASRYSNTGNYAAMVEDMENPENNTCFVRVELKSSDAKVSVADIPGKYFEWGRTITCGEWADENMLKDRILDAKKSARTLATIGGVVGGAAVGVGAMELFGNKWIGGAVEGQKALSGEERLRSQLLVLKKDNSKTHQYTQIMDKIEKIRTMCKEWTGPDKPQECGKYNWDNLYSSVKASDK